MSHYPIRKPKKTTKFDSGHFGGINVAGGATRMVGTGPKGKHPATRSKPKNFLDAPVSGCAPGSHPSW